MHLLVAPECIGPSLRSEFVTFSNVPKFGVASKSSYDDKKRQTSKKSQTLRMTLWTYATNLWDALGMVDRKAGPEEHCIGQPRATSARNTIGQKKTGRSGSAGPSI